MNDCNSESEREATQYELMCCDPVNLGNFIKFQDEARRIVTYHVHSLYQTGLVIMCSDVLWSRII